VGDRLGRQPGLNRIVAAQDAVSADDLASSQAERWVREHAIRRIPWSQHEAE
jgi:hypothetical protein